MPRTIPVLLVTLILLLLLPAMVFTGSALYHGMGADSTLDALADQYAAPRNNLGVITLLGCAPLLLIIAVLGLRRLVRKTSQDGAAYALCGALPVLLVCLFVNLEFWPRFLPARQFLGFPHGLEFVIGPLFFAPIGIGVGCVIAWLIRRRSA